MRREEIALVLLNGLMSNPQRYDYITTKVESGELTNDEATEKNIKKSLKMADQFLSILADEESKIYSIEKAYEAYKKLQSSVGGEKLGGILYDSEFIEKVESILKG